MKLGQLTGSFSQNGVCIQYVLEWVQWLAYVKLGQYRILFMKLWEVRRDVAIEVISSVMKLDQSGIFFKS